MHILVLLGFVLTLSAAALKTVYAVGLPDWAICALLAAEVAATALNARNTQDSLMRFKTSWRNRLADSLRPPNTAPQMLLPLLFVNRRIIGKFARALLHGKSM